MSKITLAATFVAFTSVVSASAGGLAEPVMEPQIVIEETEATADTSGFVQWTILALIIGAATLN